MRLHAPSVLGSVVLIALASGPMVGHADVDVSLSVFPTSAATPDAGGSWALVVRTDDPNGVSALRVAVDGVENDAVADGDPNDDILFSTGIGAVDPIPTGIGPRPPYLDLGNARTEMLFGQDLTTPSSVVVGVGTPATSSGPDPLGDPTWDDATVIARGAYPASIPSVVSADANVLDQMILPFTARADTVTTIVRVPEASGAAMLALGSLALAACAARRRRGSSRSRAMASAVAATALLGGAASAQTSTNPIEGSAPIAPWSIVLEEVVEITDGTGSAPRLEWLTSAPGSPLAYVVVQGGSIHAFDPDATPAPSPFVFLDLETAVGSLFTANEAGVRGLAFHPDFDTPGADGHRRFYVCFSRNSGATPVGNPVDFDSPGSRNHWLVIAEFTVDSGGAVLPASYRELMRVEQPFANHDSGHLAFRPDVGPGHPEYGLLYITLGDGGSGGDPFDLAGDIDTTPAPYPHGKILRIDPIAPGGAAYAIPSDNPFAGQSNRVQEVWAYGLRNPHKFTFDGWTGEMYVSDIGQGVIEEIDVGRPAADYGWNLREGSFVHDSLGTVATLPVDHPTDAFTYPVAQYDQTGSNGVDGNAAIVGGPVYRGEDVPALGGLYFFADFSNNPGPIFAVDVDDLIERDDFSDVTSLDGGRLSPYVEVRIRHGGSDETFRTVLRDSTGNPSLIRTDLRWGEGPGGELFVLNKHDGLVRRVASVVGLSDGDANRDGSVDQDDLARWTAGYGRTGDWSDGDFDGNTLVDGSDFLLWQRNRSP